MSQLLLNDSHLVIFLPVEHSQIDNGRCLTLREARVQFNLKGKRNKLVNLETLRRWCKYGYQPIGAKGPTLVFPTLLRSNERITMPEWVEWFLKESNRLRDRHAKGLR